MPGMIRKHDEIIDSLEARRRLASPKSPVQWQGHPESLVPFYDFSGPANIDVLLRARDAVGEFVVAVEAKSTRALDLR